MHYVSFLQLFGILTQGLANMDSYAVGKRI